jgi:hypothetical protein
MMKIDSDSTFNGGFHGYTVDYATGSVIQVALTGYGYLYWLAKVSETKKPRDYLGLVRNHYSLKFNRFAAGFLAFFWLSITF